MLVVDGFYRLICPCINRDEHEVNVMPIGFWMKYNLVLYKVYWFGLFVLKLVNCWSVFYKQIIMM